MIIKEGGAAASWRFERAQGKHFVSAGSRTCTEAEAMQVVEALAAEHGAAKASNGASEITRYPHSRSRKVAL